MTTGSQQPALERESRWPLVLIVGLLVAITPILVFVSDGNIGVAMAPVLAIGLVYLLWKVPVRYPTLALLFLGLAMEDPATSFAGGLWETPLKPVRALFFRRWNLILPAPPLVLSGMDMMLFLLIGIAWYRRATGSRIDGQGADAPRPLGLFYVTAVFGGWLVYGWGAVQGGFGSKYAFVQVQHVIYPMLYFFLYRLALRGPQDHPAIAKAVIAAALIRAATAFGIRHLVTPNDILSMPTATTHGDSILFAGAFCLCVCIALEMRDQKSLTLCAVALPILCLGMVANNRRLVWVQTGEALLALYFVLPKSPIKRKFLRRLLLILPAFAVYLAAGWDSQGGALFAGARTVRSLVDPDTDGSTKWRDWENFDLVTTIKSSPLFGIGYGHPFLEPFNVAGDISAYELEPYQPHNSLLGLWAFGGVIGFTLLWLVIAVGTFFAVRCYKRATRREERSAALAVVAMVVVYMTSCYGDVGYSELQSVLLVPLAFCVAGKLALVTGAWPSKSATASMGFVTR